MLTWTAAVLKPAHIVSCQHGECFVARVVKKAQTSEQKLAQPITCSLSAWHILRNFLSQLGWGMRCRYRTMDENCSPCPRDPTTKSSLQWLWKSPSPHWFMWIPPLKAEIWLTRKVPAQAEGWWHSSSSSYLCLPLHRTTLLRRHSFYSVPMFPHSELRGKHSHPLPSILL